MKQWQIYAISLILLAFIGRHWRFVAEEFGTPAFTAGEAARISNQLDSLHQIAVDFLEQGQLDNYKFVQFERPMADIADSLRFGWLADKADNMQAVVTRAYLQLAEDKLGKKYGLDRTKHNNFVYELNEARKKYYTEKREPPANWSEICLSLHRFLLSFLPFLFLILLVKRWPSKKWRIENCGELVCFVLCLGLGPLGAWIYQPKSWFQQKLDHYLRYYQSQYGYHGFSLTKAYLVAITVTILSLAKPLLGKALSNEPKVKIVKVFTDQTVEIKDCKNFCTQDNHVSIEGILENIFEKLILSIKRLMRKFFCLFCKKFEKNSLHRKFIWGLWDAPRQHILELIISAFGVRAPSSVLVF